MERGSLALPGPGKAAGVERSRAGESRSPRGSSSRALGGTGGSPIFGDHVEVRKEVKCGPDCRD